MRSLILSSLAALLCACSPVQHPPSQSALHPTTVRDASSSLAAYKRVTNRVDPVARELCRTLHPGADRNFCDFRVVIDQDPTQPANAHPSKDANDRPVIHFNINMLRTFRNDHEIAFVYAHEVGHHIARHLEKMQANTFANTVLTHSAPAGATRSLPQYAALTGFTARFEHEADVIAVHIADRAGYNPRLGSMIFDRSGVSSALLATHPPSAERKAQVANTIRVINAAKSHGRRAPVVW